MSTAALIPLVAGEADQSLQVELDGTPYRLRVFWNERAGYFSLSVLEADETPILLGLKMVKNYPLLSRFADSRLPFGDLIFLQEKGAPKRPGFDDLGVTFGLYYFEPDENGHDHEMVTATPVATIGSSWDSGLSVWDAGGTLWDQ